MENPRSTSPNSIMPPYPHMLENELDLSNLPTKLKRLRILGTPYSDDEVENAVEIARAEAEAIAREVEAQGGPQGLENKQIVALVAYLQRLGKDIEASTTAGESSSQPSEDVSASR
jgi:cbb3-type cytochrome oxidase cytochrome c subunit